VLDVWPTLGRFRRIVAMVRAPFVVRSIADALVNPDVYDELGITDGAKVARANPEHRQRIIRDLGKVTGLLDEIGVINPVTRPVWRLLGLVS
jgi:hypothetical protein